jgi:hypothetical protein
MDATIIYVMMISIALLMAILPFGVFLGLGSVLKVASNDTRMIGVYIVGAMIVSYLTAFGAFVLIQRHNCGQIKSIKQAAKNANIAFGIQAATLSIAWLIPGLRGVATSLMPPDLDPAILDSIGYSYWSFWAALFGTAIGGTLSGVCT